MFQVSVDHAPLERSWLLAENVVQIPLGSGELGRFVN